jgi:hypothetical protein
MNNSNEPVGSIKGISTLVRARFGPGMLLQHEDLEQLNTYTRDLSRLLFQSFFGCGVICGLVVDADLDCKKLKVTVQPGVALTCAGEPVYVPPGIQAFFIREDFNLETATHLWVKLCLTKKCCAPRTTTCSSDDDEATSDCTREKDGFEIQVVQQRPDCACGCPEPANNEPPHVVENPCKCVRPDLPCYKPHYDGTCGCTCGECSDCHCQCILLARLVKTNNQAKPWRADHRVRRFIRPVLMRDPQVAKEQSPKTVPTTYQAQTMSRSVEQAAEDAALLTVKQAAEQAAHDAAQREAKKIAGEVGERAAAEVVRQVVAQVALEAARKAIKEAAEQAALPTAEPVPEEGNRVEASQEEEVEKPAASGKKPEKTTKSSKMNKSGLPNS